MATDSFAHLHVHTEFSMLDGAARVKELVAAAVEDGQPAIAMTDHGNMYGALDFHAACLEHGIKPIIGIEAYQAGESRHERPVRRGRVDDTGGDVDGGQKLYHHLTLLAESTAGYRNLMKLSSAAYLEGYYIKPRVDWELLERYHDGLIATTGCMGGVVSQALDRGDSEGALKLAGRLQDIFGTDNTFVELQDHGVAHQKTINAGLVEIAGALGAPVLATNDSHYTRMEDHLAHDALLCVQTGSMISDTSRFRFESPDQCYLKSAAQMRELFRELPAACDNTLWIAERADVKIDLGGTHLPHFEVPPEFLNADEYLRSLAFAGARERYGEPVPTAVGDRLEAELGVISDMGFAVYFLVVGDLMDHARKSKIRAGLRGSGAASCVAYCLGISHIEPLQYGLIFERFLNPGRKEMPDIDMDFDERYRGEMIRYATEKYGADHVAQIVTFSTIKARAAVRDAARVLGFPYTLGDRIAKLMPALIMGRDTPLWACLEKTDEHADGYKMAGDLRELANIDAEARKVIDVALGLEGLRRQDGIHAAAVVITPEPLTEYLPIQRKPDSGGDPDSAPIVTQYEMNGVASLGLLKMDFLGLRNLSVIERALDVIESRTGERPDIDAVPLDDPSVFEMLRRGDTMGVFQLEGGPMRSLMRSLAPTHFEDIGALVALYRPGPMGSNMHNDYAERKNGRKPVTYLHPDLEEILGETYGVMAYQELLIRTAQKFAGYSLGDADNLRKACAKKQRSLIAKERKSFIEACVKTGYTEELGKQLFDIIEPFADYAFPKAHAICYALIAYQTAWLKAHYPVEYLAALLTSVKDDKDRTAVYLAECRARGITVTVPDVNRAVSDFTAHVGDEDSPERSREERASTTGTIQFGMSGVRNVGEGLVAHIIAARREGGPFTDFYDFCSRVHTTVLNKRSIESLIKAGAFDSMGHPRRGLCLVFEDVVDRSLARRREAEVGVMSLFGDGGEDSTYDDARVPIPDLEFDKDQRLAFEKEMLGLYLSDHPLLGVEGALRKYTDATIAELRAAGLEPGREGETRSVGGVITGLSRRYTKKGELMATFTLEDLASTIDTWVFPRTMQDYGSILADDAVVVVKGRLDLRDETPKLVSVEISRPHLTTSGPVRINLRVPALSADLIERLKEVLARHPGQSPVHLVLGDTVLRLPDEFAVDEGNGLWGELRAVVSGDIA